MAFGQYQRPRDGSASSPQAVRKSDFKNKWRSGFGNLSRAKPRDDARYQWTNHVLGKMGYYQLSEGRIKRVVASPKRIEEGVAPGTIAVMQPGTGKRREEIWVMYQVLNPESRNLKLKEVHVSSFKIHGARKRIITAWRYPGVSKPRGPVPVPDDILNDLKDLV